MEELMLPQQLQCAYIVALSARPANPHLSLNTPPPFLFPQVVGEMKELVSRYDAAVVEEQELSPEKRIVANVGKMDAKKHLAANVTSVMSSNINQVSR